MDPVARRLSLPATAESIAPFQDFVRSGAIAAGLPPDELGKLDLVLEELLVNIARYAYTSASGEAEVAITADGPGKVSLEISDSGNPFNLLDADPPVLGGALADRPIGGLGVFLVRSLVGSLTYRREGGRNIVSFEFPGPHA